MRPGYEQQNVHTLGFVENMGTAWVVIGWVLAAMSLVSMVWGLAVAFPMIQEMLNNPGAGPQPNMFNLGSPGQTILSWVSILGMLIWMILDISDRRGNYLWLLPQVLCGCCCGLGFVTLPVYILAGRK
jgi:hypothetical protein